MGYENFQNGSVSDGRGIVLWVPAIADPEKPTVAELTAPTAKRITYGLAGDGFSLTPTSQKITITRYTARQSVTKQGVKSYELVIKYAYNRQTPTEVEELMVPGTQGFFVQILGYPNDHVIAADTKVNYVVPVELTESDDVPPTANTEMFKTMSPDITGTVRTEVSVVAGP